MNAGAKRMAVAYRWPKTLLLPPKPPRLVYLDLNHWISLAKAHSGHSSGQQFRDLLQELDGARKAGRAFFPISDTIFIEASKIGPHRQRQDLRDVIEHLSGYEVVTSRTVIAAHEVEATFDDIVGPSTRPVNTMAYLDWGVLRALGLAGGVKVYDENGDDQTEQARLVFKDGPEAFDKVVAEGEWQLQRDVLGGPELADEPSMRAKGWDPRASMQIATRRAAEEMAQVQRFNSDPSWRRGRIRDVVAAHECLVEWTRLLNEATRDRGITLADLFPKPADARAAFDAMPSFDVAVSIKTSYHQDPNHRWTPNDMHDIDALGSTLPYCDVVVSDKAVVSHVERTGLADRLGCTVLSNLSELPALI